MHPGLRMLPIICALGIEMIVFGLVYEKYVLEIVSTSITEKGTFLGRLLIRTIAMRSLLGVMDSASQISLSDGRTGLS